MAIILYGEKFPFAHLYIGIFCYLVINFSDIVNNVTECRLMTQNNLKIGLCK